MHIKYITKFVLLHVLITKMNARTRGNAQRERTFPERERACRRKKKKKRKNEMKEEKVEWKNEREIDGT